jgi:hypothetical protein
MFILVRNQQRRNNQELKTMLKRTEITIETERYLVIGQHREMTVPQCVRCNHNVAMLTVFDAARVTGYTTAMISRLADSGKLHFAVTPEGQLLICPDSLSQNDWQIG